jgi:hypothetical protein
MTTKIESKTIAIVSKTEQLRYLISNQTEGKHDKIHFICMTPAVEYEANKMGVSYTSVEDLYDHEELNNMGAKSWATFEEFAEYLDSKLDRDFSEICKKGYFSSVPFTYLFKIFHDTIQGNLYKLQAIIGFISPSTIICFRNQEAISHFDLKYEIGDQVFKLLKLLKSKFRYELISYSIAVTKLENSEKSHKVKDKKDIRSQILSIIEDKTNVQIRGVCSDNRYLLAKIILKGVIKFTIQKLRENPKLKTIAIGRNNTLAQLSEYSSEWQQIGGKVISIGKIMNECDKFTSADIDSSSLLSKFGITAKRLEEFWQNLESELEFKKWFEYQDINFFSIISPWLKQFIFFVFPACILSEDKIEKGLKKCQASVFLTPSATHKTEISAVLACKRLGIKVCSIQHGGMGFFKSSLFEYSDYRNINYAYVYGQGVADFFQKEYNIDSRDNLAKPIAIGNPVLQKIYHEQRCKKQSSLEKKKRILYIPTHFELKFIFYGWNCYPSVWYGQLQRKIVEAIKSFPDVTLYIKQYPLLTTEDPLQMYVKDRKIDNVVFIPRNIDMMYYLDNADLFINDYPTTSLLKILCTRKPIIVYYNPKYFDMSIESQKLLKRRGELYDIEEEFLSAIKKFCMQKSWPEIENPDDTFLYQYGICGATINTEEKVAEHLLSILNSQKADFK